MKLKLSEELTFRGMVNQTTYPDLTALDGDPITFYWGVDPSADSMTVGNLAAAMMVKLFIAHGHKAVLLVGGATGMVGDPDGKKTERDLLDQDTINRNKQAIAEQYKAIFGEHDFTLVDNYDWFKDMGYLQFLRDVGKHVPTRQMLAREFVQSRLKEGGAGISYAEFSYVLIQAYDFLYMYENMGVTLQVCGSDQWGNSIAGVDLIRRKTGGEAHVYSSPLVINQVTGQKFGKSEEGAIWLDAKKTSPYKFYQFWVGTDDQSCESFLKIFTELERDEIESVLSECRANPASRSAQKRLAYEVTKIVHGEDQAKKQARVAEAVAAQKLEGLSEDELMTLKEEIPQARSSSNGSIAEALVDSGLAPSNSEARRLISSNAVYINGEAVGNRENFSEQDFRGGKLLLRRGKAYKDSALVEL